MREGKRCGSLISFFGDDMLVVCEDSKEHLANLSMIMLWFEAMSGLNINLEKSSVFPMSSVEDLDGLALEIGCTTETLPTM